MNRNETIERMQEAIAQIADKAELIVAEANIGNGKEVYLAKTILDIAAPYRSKRA